MPIWVADYVLMGYGTGAIMAVPGHDDRDHAFATKFGIEITTVVAPEDGSEPEGCFTEHGIAINSACEALSLDGLRTAEAKAKMIDWLVEHHCGERRVTYRLRDWLFSRQRYWENPSLWCSTPKEIATLSRLRGCPSNFPTWPTMSRWFLTNHNPFSPKQPIGCIPPRAPPASPRIDCHQKPQ